MPAGVAPSFVATESMSNRKSIRSRCGRRTIDVLAHPVLKPTITASINVLKMLWDYRYYAVPHAACETVPEGNIRLVTETGEGVRTCVVRRHGFERICHAHPTELDDDWSRAYDKRIGMPLSTLDAHRRPR